MVYTLAEGVKKFGIMYPDKWGLILTNMTAIYKLNEVDKSRWLDNTISRGNLKRKVKAIKELEQNIAIITYAFDEAPESNDKKVARILWLSWVNFIKIITNQIVDIEAHLDLQEELA